MSIRPKPIGFILTPLTLKYVPVNVPELALALRLVSEPLAYVFGAIWPNLGPLTVSLVAFPGTGVDGAVFEAEFGLVLFGQLVEFCVGE